VGKAVVQGNVEFVVPARMEEPIVQSPKLGIKPEGRLQLTCEFLKGRWTFVGDWGGDGNYTGLAVTGKRMGFAP